ncbi:restriction endonuclease subunit S [Oryzisolibacter sp. LB2S]|uniref:restriction endonuclease subunit S n=1 Tax=Alicycliphilus soli TaxID=3228789 RepID=UPI0034575105
MNKLFKSDQWTSHPLIEVATLQRGYDLPVQDRNVGSFPIFAANGPVGFHDTAKCKGPGVVTGRSGTIGKVQFVEGDYWPLNTSLYVTDFHGNHPKWVYYMLQSFGLEKYAQGAGVPTLNRNLVHHEPVRVPPLEEQRRIAAILDQAETLRTQRRSALALLDSLTQSLFLEMFGDPVANPKGWGMSTIGDLAEVQGGLQVTSARKNLPVEVPYLRVANVYRGVLDLSEIKTIRATPAEMQRTTLVNNDLLVVEGHGNPNEIGRAALWNGEIEQCVHQNHLIRARFDCTKVEPVFASEYVNSPGGRQHLLRAGKSTSGLNTISVSNVRETPIALPPLPLQQSFATRIAAIEALKATHRRALAALDELFASLQQRAFAGALST